MIFFLYRFKNLHNHVFLHHSQTCKIKVSPLTKKCPTYFSCEVCHKVIRDLNIFRNHQESQHGLTLENFNEKIDKLFFEDNPHDIRKQSNDVPYCRKCGKIVENRYAMRFEKLLKALLKHLISNVKFLK